MSSRFASLSRPSVCPRLRRRSRSSTDSTREHPSVQSPGQCSSKTSASPLSKASVRRSIGPALVEVGGGVGKRRRHGRARSGRWQNSGSVNVNGEAVVASNFHLDGQPRRVGEGLPALGRRADHASGERSSPHIPTCRLAKHANSSSQLEAAARLSTTLRAVQPVRLTFDTDRQYSPADRRPRDSWKCPSSDPVASATCACEGPAPWRSLRRRASVRRSSALTGPQANASTGKARIAYDAGAKRARARISHVRRINTMALAVTGEAATDGSVAVGFNLNFSLDPGRRIEPVASTACALRAQCERGSIAIATTMVSATRRSRSKRAPWSRPALGLSEKPTDDRGNGAGRRARDIHAGRGRNRRRQSRRSQSGAQEGAAGRRSTPWRACRSRNRPGRRRRDRRRRRQKRRDWLRRPRRSNCIDEAGKVVATTQTDYDGLLPVRADRLRPLQHPDSSGVRRRCEGPAGSECEGGGRRSPVNGAVGRDSRHCQLPQIASAD